MFLSTKSSGFRVRGSGFGALRTSHLALFAVIFAIVSMSGCSGKRNIGQKAFFDFDSLVNVQLADLNRTRYELSKSVEIDGKDEQTRFVPDSAQWANELEIFRELDQLNKASFRDAYVISDTRDTNSNLTVREIRAQRPVPVSLVKFYFLNTPKDLRRIEATWLEENSLYTNTRRMVMELEPSNNRQILHRYRIEGFQKMVMDDSVRFVVAGELTR